MKFYSYLCTDGRKETGRPQWDTQRRSRSQNHAPSLLLLLLRLLRLLLLLRLWLLLLLLLWLLLL